jgi:DNA (cytosine-5)-methyltransferase 1
MIYGLDLFSGIAGFSRALDEFVCPIAYCESDPYCQAVLLSRMREGLLQHAPIWDDITTLQKDLLPDGIDIITAGFPCQDISVAGNGAGLEGKRSGLYSELRRLVGEILPRFIFMENVPALSVRGLDRIGLDFASLGYDFRWTTLSAQEVGACHIRERWWGLAHSDRLRLREKCGEENREEPDTAGAIQPNNFSFSWGNSEPPERLFEPRVDRTGDGIPNKMDRMRALGNSVVPQAARKAFMKLLGARAALRDKP